jgi:peptidoglycan/LPS O-acetylase OafA/YrhL
VKYRRDIEGLRAIAVVVVLLYHFGVPGLRGGFIGVDVFFVISGFLITSLLLDERTRKGRISITGFYARRARRLLPISATVLVATAIAGALVLPATRLPDLAADVRWAAAFAANFLFAKRGADYLTADLAPSALRHYWSLAVEEQFYVVWPALIMLVTLGARSVRRRVGVAMALLIAASFTASVVLTPRTPSWAYYGLHTRAWELGVGALLATLITRAERIPPAVRAALGWLGIGGIAYAAWAYGTVAFPSWTAAVPVLASALVLVAGPVVRGSPAWLLSTPPMRWLGTRSYSLYLWHWPVLVLAEAHLERSLTGPEKLAAVAAVVVLSEAGYRIIEHPIRSSPRLIARRGLSLAMGASLVAVALVAAAVVNAYRPDLSTGVVAAAPSAPIVTTTLPPPPPTTTGPVETTTTLPAPPAAISTEGAAPLDAIAAALGVDVVPDNLKPGLREAGTDLPILYSNGCHQWFKTTVKKRCIFGDPNGTVTIALWGDSHAAQWFAPLEAIAMEHHWRLIAMTQGGCPYIDVPTFNESANAPLANCAPWRDSARAFMIEQHVDVVFVSQAYAEVAFSTRQPIAADDWTAHLPDVLNGLRADGVEPIVIGDAADPAQEVPSCLAEHRHDIASCEARDDDAHTATVIAAIRSVTTGLGVGFIDPTRWLCSDHRCPTVVGDMLAYRDGHHLTSSFALWLTPLLDALIGPFVDDLVRYRLLSAG